MNGERWTGDAGERGTCAVQCQVSQLWLQVTGGVRRVLPRCVLVVSAASAAQRSWSAPPSHQSSVVSPAPRACARRAGSLWFGCELISSLGRDRRGQYYRGACCYLGHGHGTSAGTGCESTLLVVSEHLETNAVKEAPAIGVLSIGMARSAGAESMECRNHRQPFCSASSKTQIIVAAVFP